MLKVSNINTFYGKLQALWDVSFRVDKKEIVTLVGANGAGKTTKIKIMMDMIKPRAGAVKIFGLDHTKHIKEIKNRVGYVGEDQFYYGDKTVAWTGKFVSEFYNNWDTK